VTQSDSIAIFGKIVPSDVDGPGTRAVIHFAGCKVGCKGCFNPHTHDATAPGVWRADAFTLARQILAVSDRVTISGGEPTDQMEGLYDLCSALRALGCDDIVMFTGRRVEALERRHTLWPTLIALELVDVVVDGPFVQGRMAKEGMRGSDNQRILPITRKWSETDFADRDVEFSIGADGEVILTGFPDAELLALLG
jgi:anaerobic ribonucleoside-triphosphate reductase activating protein